MTSTKRQKKQRKNKKGKGKFSEHSQNLDHIHKTASLVKGETRKPFHKTFGQDSVHRVRESIYGVQKQEKNEERARFRAELQESRDLERSQRDAILAAKKDELREKQKERRQEHELAKERRAQAAASRKKERYSSIKQSIGGKYRRKRPRTQKKIKNKRRY